MEGAENERVSERIYCIYRSVIREKLGRRLFRRRDIRLSE